jgi:Cys-tRNA(Pro)/Cys-tRNA(Cys) deacylase
MLEAKGIEFSPVEVPVEKLGAHETAQILGVSPSLVYKSIIIVREKKGNPIVAIVPGPLRVVLKLLADLLG